LSVKKLTGQQFAEIFAALQAAEQAQLGTAPRRHSRLDIEGGRVQIVDIASKTAYTALTRDISFDGLTLLQSRAPAPGAQVVVALARKKQGQYQIRCSVVQVKELAENLYSVRCTFIALHEAVPAPAAPPLAAAAPATSAATPPAAAAAAPATPAPPAPAPTPAAA
jgi:hypothetical protein